MILSLVEIGCFDNLQRFAMHTISLVDPATRLFTEGSAYLPKPSQSLATSASMPCNSAIHLLTCDIQQNCKPINADTMVLCNSEEAEQTCAVLKRLNKSA